MKNCVQSASLPRRQATLIMRRQFGSVGPAIRPGHGPAHPCSRSSLEELGFRRIRYQVRSESPSHDRPGFSSCIQLGVRPGWADSDSSSGPAGPGFASGFRVRVGFKSGFKFRVGLKLVLGPEPGWASESGPGSESGGEVKGCRGHPDYGAGTRPWQGRANLMACWPIRRGESRGLYHRGEGGEYLEAARPAVAPWLAVARGPSHSGRDGIVTVCGSSGFLRPLP